MILLPINILYCRCRYTYTLFSSNVHTLHRNIFIARRKSTRDSFTDSLNNGNDPGGGSANQDQQANNKNNAPNNSQGATSSGSKGDLWQQTLQVLVPPPTSDPGRGALE